MDLRAFIDNVRSRLRLPQSPGKQEGSNISQAEKIVVFSLACVVAGVLWLLINLGKDFTVTVELPIEYGQFPEGMAPAESLPQSIDASFSGEGWQLLSIYTAPPRISVDAESGRVNIQDVVQGQIGTSQALTLNRTIPEQIDLTIEEAITRKVPVVPHLELDFAGQFGLVGALQVTPDSVEVRGARSLVEEITEWHTEEVQFGSIEEDLRKMLALRSPGDLLSLNHDEIEIAANVEEFTEGVIRVPVEVEGISGRPNLVLSPSAVTIRYNVPVFQYQQVQEERLFQAVVSYADIEADNTGYIEPQILVDDARYEVSLRSVHPRRLSYFMIID